MTDTWQSLGSITERIKDKLAPVIFMVPVQGTLAVAVIAEAIKSGNKPETIICEAIRCYVGDA
jgi:exonuclease VII large subunit